MCGIAGHVGREGGPEQRTADLRRMCGAIRHRGPDDEGHFIADGVALGMRRLSIIDVGGGRQPISNEDGAITVVFNGEIYNHREIQRRLELAGHRFATHCDTEALVHLYEEKGDDLVHQLRGMFGFAIWDARRERLLVARDRLGIKPMYYWETPEGGVAFASEARSLLTLPDFPRQLDRAAVGLYLSLGYVPDPCSVFEAVKKLPPGHRLSWERGRGVTVERYWTPAREESGVRDEGEAIEETRRLLRECVESHLESEVPLGAFLSGGIDSSAVVAQMAQLMDRPVQTFAIGFDEPEFNEAPHAATVAADIGTVHRELIVRPDADALVEQVVCGFDEPFADSSALPTYLVAQLARREVTVALSGDGGDELFGGYTRYSDTLGRRQLAPAALRRLVGATGRLLPHGVLGRNRLVDLGRAREGRYTATVAVSLQRAEGGVATDALAEEGVSFDALLAPYFAEGAGRDFTTQMTIVDLMTYLPGDILTKVDRMSMAVSLEARVPLLDHHLVEFAVALPGRFKISNGVGKSVLRKAIEGLVPPQVLTKPKQGFGVPLGRWFRTDLRHRVEALLRPDSPIYAYVDRGAVRRITDEHRVGRRDHSHMIWRLMVLDIWLVALARDELVRPWAIDRTASVSAAVDLAS